MARIVKPLMLIAAPETAIYTTVFLGGGKVSLASAECDRTLVLSIPHSSDHIMERINELTTMYSLDSKEAARLHWVVKTYPIVEHDNQIIIELKNIMAARKLATMPKVSREKIKKAQDRAALLDLENIDL